MYFIKSVVASKIFIIVFCLQIGQVMAQRLEHLDIEENTKSIVVIDLSSFVTDPNLNGSAWAYDAARALVAIQGIVNRETPRFFIIYFKNALGAPSGVANADGDFDRFWLDWLNQDDRLLMPYKIIKLNDVWEVIDYFLPLIQGIVLWDENVPATAMVANSFAGAQSLIPLRATNEKESFTLEFLSKFSQFPIVMDLSNKFTGKGVIPETSITSTGSSKCDAYLWAIEKLIKTGLCDSRYIAYYLDGMPTPYLHTSPQGEPLPYGDLGNRAVFNADYWIARKAFFFDLSPWEDESASDDLHQVVGEDGRTLRSLLIALNEANQQDVVIVCGGFCAWWVKYCADAILPSSHVKPKHGAVETEWQFVELLSEFNGTMDADAYGLIGMANASVFQHYPLAHYAQEDPEEDAPMFDPQITYVLFGMLDYDSSAWLTQAYWTIWMDSGRGQLPLWWGFNPILSDRVPMVFDAIFSSRTPCDVIGADELLGYTTANLLYHRPRSGLPQAGDLFYRTARPYYDRFDMRSIVFQISGNSGPANEPSLKLLGELAPMGVGFQGGQRVKDGPHHGSVFISQVMDLGPHLSEDEVATQIEHQLKRKDRGNFLFFRCILTRPSTLLNAISKIHERSPELKFEIPLVPHYFELMKQAIH